MPIVTLTHLPAQVVQYLLVALGLGTLPTASGSWPVFEGKEPDSPDDCVTVYDTVGKLQGAIQPTGEQHEQYGIQIRVRAQDRETGAQKIRTIADTLNQSVLRTSVTVSSSTYLVQSLNQTSSVLPLGYESGVSKREIFTVNFTVSLTQTS